MRYFNTAGPCDPTLNYMLPAGQRLPGAHELIDRGMYFVVHAPRQSGKTTSLTALADEVSAAGDRVAVLVSCEESLAAGDDYGAAEDILLEQIHDAAEDRDYPQEWLPPDPWPQAQPGNRIFRGLRAWAKQCPVPIVLIFDEIDTLQGMSMMTMLRQLRNGYRLRPDRFPASVVLCGLRDVRDYKKTSDTEPTYLGSPSPFNIAVKSLRIHDFSADEIAALYRQHTTNTGQVFTDAAIQQAFWYSAGQPWLVNALAREVIDEMAIAPPTPITEHHIDTAAQRLIAARATHLDSLADKLNEPRIRRVIEALLGEQLFQVGDPTYHDDVSYAQDLGLVARAQPLAIANPIYREVIARVVAQPVIDMVAACPHSFLLADGRVDVDRILREFIVFWREHGDLINAERGYDESTVKLVLMGYMYRIVNGGGFVDSEYGSGRRHVDLLIRKPYTASDGSMALQREALELKVRRHGEADPIDEGLDQLDAYLAKLGLETGTLVIFDRRHNAPPLTERGVFSDETTAEGRKVCLLRL